MANPQQNPTPKNILSGLFGPKFLDDPDALSGLLGNASGATATPSGTSGPSVPPDASGTPNVGDSAPVTGIVPKSFNEWAQDPVNLAKIPRQINNSPLPGASPAIPPLIARPADDSASSAVPQTQDATLRGVTQGAQSTPQPTSSAMPSMPTVSTPDLFPNRADWLKANPNTAAIPLPPHKYGTRGSIAMALATLGDTMGAALTGGRPVVGPHWLEQTQAGIDYQRNLPVITQQAQTAAYEKAQEEAGKSTSIAGTQAQTAHIAAETQALLGGGPFYAQAGKVRDEITQMWQSGNLAPDAFDKAVQIKLQGLDPRVRNVMNQSGDFLQQVKSLPQTPPKFTAGASGIEPIVYRGQNYGVTPVQVSKT